MSARTKNDSIGKAGEKRIAQLLETLGANDVIASSHNSHPDLSFVFHGVSHAIECKTMKPIYSGRISSVHIRRSEIESMRQLSDVNSEITKGLIVEVRPQGKERPYYMFVHWSTVEQMYNKTKPEVLSLSFHTICGQGMHLKNYLATSILLKGFSK
jgi:Holliday junction resolvase